MLILMLGVTAISCHSRQDSQDGQTSGVSTESEGSRTRKRSHPARATGSLAHVLLYMWRTRCGRLSSPGRAGDDHIQKTKVISVLEIVRASAIG